MVKKRTGLILLLLGVLLLIIGFIYDGIFAGIPYQDPTLELAQKYMNNESIGYAFYKIGFAVLIIGIIVVLFQGVYKKIYQGGKIMNFQKVKDEIESFWNKQDESWNEDNPVLC